MQNTNTNSQGEDPLPQGYYYLPSKANGRKPYPLDEITVHINSQNTKSGLSVDIESPEVTKEVKFHYPEGVWQSYGLINRRKLLDNLVYIFTAHLPFILSHDTKLVYNSAYPQVFSWTNQTFMRFLPAYWFLHKGKRGSKTPTVLKTLLNSTSTFLADRDDQPPEFPETLNKNVVIPFTFGKDSLLTYNLAKEIGLNPTLIYFNEPTEVYAAPHKLELIDKFYKETGQKVTYIHNSLGTLRASGEGWFGWELALTSWALLSLPFAHQSQAAYIIFSNPRSDNMFMYDEDGYKVIPTYEESDQATEEISLVTQSLSEGEVSVTTFLMGLMNLAIIAVLKDRYKDSFKYLMSCWAENEHASENRWCENCSKCARTYMYLLAQGIDPKDAGFKSDMLSSKKRKLYNVFGKRASGTGWDAFGLNTEEQALGYYIACLRGYKGELIDEFRQTDLYKQVGKNYYKLVDEYYTRHPESVIPPRYKPQINEILDESLERVRRELYELKKRNTNKK